jgi:hypothetical protein
VISEIHGDNSMTFVSELTRSRNKMRLWRYEILTREECARRTSDARVDFIDHHSQRDFRRVGDVSAVVQRAALFLDVDDEYSAGGRDSSVGPDE